MTGLYDNATIDIISSINDEWGKRYESVGYSELSVRVEPVNKPVRDNTGRELLANTLIIISNPDVDVQWDDKIKIKTIDDDQVDTADKKYSIKSKFKVSGFLSSHWEILV